MSILPLEITELIIDTLVQDDPNLASTKDCSLVCYYFLLICRKHIFASISLNPGHEKHISPDKKRPQKATTPMFQRLLSTTPEIADYIRDLEFCIVSDDLNSSSSIDTFNKITRLRSLHVSVAYQIRRFPWSGTPLPPALLHLLHLSSLRKISFGSHSGPMIAHICAEQGAGGKPFIDFTSLSHLSFELRGCDFRGLNHVAIFHNLLSRCKWLVNVRIQVSDEEIKLSGLSKMLDPCAQTLKHIEVDVVDAFYDLVECSDPLIGLSDELAQMSNKSMLETITIKVGIIADTDACQVGHMWGRLDMVLMQSRWPKLRRVSLTIEIDYYGPGPSGLYMENALRKLRETQFPGLSSTKSLLFEFEVRKAL